MVKIIVLFEKIFFFSNRWLKLSISINKSLIQNLRWAVRAAIEHSFANRQTLTSWDAFQYWTSSKVRHRERQHQKNFHFSKFSSVKLAPLTLNFSWYVVKNGTKLMKVLSFIDSLFWFLYLSETISDYFETSYHLYISFLFCITCNLFYSYMTCHCYIY